MDNASKALIIAGAILIAVMLVSLGVMLYNTASGVAESTTGTVEALGVEGYNAQFNQYVGVRQNASIAQGLIDKVIANNSNSDTVVQLRLTGSVPAASGTGRTNVNVAMTSTVATLRTMRNQITSKDTLYTITIENYDTTGVISQLLITAEDRN